MYKSTPLYGGAITADIPQNFIDASNLRQIPDNQEVWLDQDGFTSIVIEILERVDAATDEEAFRAHALDLVGDDTSVGIDAGNVKRIQSKHQERSMFTLSTTAPPGKNEQERRKTLAAKDGGAVDDSNVQILLGLIRLPKQETDILISVNLPDATSEQQQSMLEARDHLLESFDIKDWELFC